MLSLWFVLAWAGMNGRCSSVIQTTCAETILWIAVRLVWAGCCAETILWIAGGWSFPAYSRRRAGCAVTIEQRNRGLLPYRPMGTFFVVVPTPILHLFLGIRKA